MLGKLRAVGGELPGHASRENAFRGGQFNCTVREVIGYYITMEEYYVEEMVNKAIALDELVRLPLLFACMSTNHADHPLSAMAVGHGFAPMMGTGSFSTMLRR